MPNTNTLLVSWMPESYSKNCCPFEVNLYFSGITISPAVIKLSKLSALDFERRIVLFIESNLGSAAILDSLINYCLLVRGVEVLIRPLDYLRILGVYSSITNPSSRTANVSPFLLSYVLHICILSPPAYFLLFMSSLI